MVEKTIRCGKEENKKKVGNDPRRQFAGVSPYLVDDVRDDVRLKKSII